MALASTGSKVVFIDVGGDSGTAGTWRLWRDTARGGVVYVANGDVSYVALP